MVLHPRFNQVQTRERKNNQDLPPQVLRVARVCFDNGGDCKFEWPPEDGIPDRQLHPPLFSGCAAGTEAYGLPAKNLAGFSLPLNFLRISRHHLYVNTTLLPRCKGYGLEYQPFIPVKRIIL